MSSSDKITEKRFKGVLILNYRTGDMRIVKRPKKSYDPFEFPVEIDLTIKVPPLPKAEIKGDIIVPQTKINKIVVKLLDEAKGGGKHEI